MDDVKFFVLLAYVFGLIISISLIGAFHDCPWSLRRHAKIAFAACWLLLILPVFNIIGAFWLYYAIKKEHLYQASFNNRMNVIVPPRHYNCRCVMRPKTGLGEDDEHA